MPLMVNFLPLAVKNEVKGFGEEVPLALQKARDQVASGGADSKITLWFGAADKDTRIRVRDNLARLRSFVQNHNVKCMLRLDRPATENALAEHVPGGLIGGAGMSSMQRIDVARGALGGTNVGQLNLSPNFANLPNYATGPVSAFADQDRFETIVHELSHIVLGTGDEALNDGSTAYGGTAARNLATQDAGRAINNAENWGLFVEEFRG